MKKIFMLPLILLLLSLKTYSQCSMPAAYSQLNTNNVSARINLGDAFWDLVGSAQYETPKGNKIHSLFAHAIWVGGFDGGNLHLAAQTYRQGYMGSTVNCWFPDCADYYAGPLDTATTQAADCLGFDKIWNLHKTTVDSFVNGLYPVIPNEILTWPGNGTGGAAKQFAPYFDADGDGIYNPNNGDFPLIKGDQMLFYIANDNGNTHNETGGTPLGVEFHYSAYVYKCSADTADENILNNTTFYNIKIINRSMNTYDSVYVGLWYDLDLGCYMDDYVGCDTTLNLAYGYNGDNNDATCGSAGYGTNPPAIGSVILRGPKNSSGNNLGMTIFLYYENNYLPVNGNPQSALGCYQYMSGTLLDGSRWLDNNGKPTNYFYSGDPVTQTGWTEYNAGIPPQDRRFLQSTGPFKLLPGAENEIDYAIVWSRDTALDNFQQVGKLRSDVQKIQQWFDTGVGPCGSLLSIENNDAERNNISLNIYPNPSASGIFNVQTNVKEKSAHLEVYNLLGQKMYENKISSPNQKINLTHLPQGFYILRLKGEKVNAGAKILIQN